MNKVVLLLVISLSLSICGCNEDDDTVTTGIIGTVEFGRGDCMPPTQHEYSPYNGRVYFVVKDDWDNFGDESSDLKKIVSMFELNKENYQQSCEKEFIWLCLKKSMYIQKKTQ